MKLRTILMCIMLSLMATHAFATANVSGTVTDASSQPLAGISVQFYNAATGSTITKAGVTDTSGNYTVTSVPTGTYKVIFFGNNAQGAPYVQKWYNGATSFDTATSISVASTALTGINAVMGAAATQPSVNLGSVSNGAAGTVVKIPVSLVTGGAAISSAGLTITYDPAKVLAVTSYDPADPLQTPDLGAAASAAGKTISDSSPSEGTYILGILSTTNTRVINDGVLANLYFELAGSATGPITLANAPSASDPSGVAITVTGSNGTISFPDLTKPVVGTFTVPASSTSLGLSVTLTATDNVAVTGYMITETSTAPSASASGWSATAPTSYTAGSEGNVTLYAWAKDAAGNVSDAKTASVTITLPDTTKPVVGAFTVPATGTSLTVNVSSFTATDNKGVTGYLITESSSEPSASAAGWSSTAPASYTVTATISEGVATAVTLYAWAKDPSNNVSTAVTATTTLTIPDATRPTVGAFSIPATGTALAVPVSTFTATDNKGVTGYLVTESSSTPAADATGWTSTAPTSYTVTASVPQAVATSVTLYGWAKDAAGNVSNASSATTVLTLPDTTKPVVTAFGIPAAGTTATVNVDSFTATDNVGVTGYLLTESETAPASDATGWSSSAPTSYTFTGLPQGVATAKTLYAWAKDVAGNVSLSLSDSVTITLTGPSLTFSPTVLANGTSTKNPALNYAGTVTGIGTVTLSLTNNGAPVAVPVTDGAFNTAISLAEGANVLVTTATDDNGTTTDTRTITLDPNLADLAVTSPVNGSFTKNTFVDVVGTVGAPQSTTVTVKLNDEAPQTATLVGDSFTMPLNLVAGANTILVTATDSVTGAHTQTIGITSDTTLPELNVTSPADAFATPKSSIVLTGTVDDSVTTATVAVTVDGVALETQPTVTAGAFSATIALPTVKTYSVVVTATDQSGNSATVTRNIIRKDPSGNATDGVSTPTIADVQKALQFVLGFATPTSDELINMDVAPLSGGKPAPDGVVNDADALVILEKVVGAVTW